MNQLSSHRASFTGLLAMLAAALVLLPLMHADRALRFALEFALVVAMVVTLWRLRPRTGLLVAAALFALLNRIAATTNLLSPESTWVVLEHLGSAVFLVALAVGITANVWRTREVSVDTIVGGIAVYVIIGVVWSGLYQLTEFLAPGSFAVTHPAPEHWGAWETTPGTYPRLLFFSFVTLTTLGYGDVVPVSVEATLLATAEAVVGPIYLTVLIARLVGLHVAQATRDASNAPDDPPV